MSERGLVGVVPSSSNSNLPAAVDGRKVVWAGQESVETTTEQATTVAITKKTSAGSTRALNTDGSRRFLLNRNGDLLEVEEQYGKIDRHGTSHVFPSDLKEAMNILGYTTITDDQATQLTQVFELQGPTLGFGLEEFVKLRAFFNGVNDIDVAKVLQPPAGEVNHASVEGALAQDESQGLDEDLSDSKAMAEYAPWRRALGRQLESNWWGKTMMVLLILDILRFFVELLVVQGVFGDYDPDESHPLFEPLDGLTSTYQLDVVLHGMSIILLAIFTLEIILLIVAFGVQFFKHWGYIIDFIVVPLSLGLEAGGPRSLGGFLVLVRLWRLIRLINALAEKDAALIYVKLNVLERGLDTVQRHFHHIVKIIGIKTEECKKLTEDLQYYRSGGLEGRRAVSKGLLDLKKENDEVRLDPKLLAETKVIFAMFDTDQNGQITVDEMTARAQDAGIATLSTPEGARALIECFDDTHTGLLNLQNFSKIRALFNGQFEVRDPLLDHKLFETGLATLRHAVTHVLLDDNEDPALLIHHQKVDPDPDRRALWRKEMGEVLESDRWVTCSTVLLVIDMIRFFLELMNNQKTFTRDRDLIDEIDHVLHVISLVFLSLFAAELVLLIIAFGRRFFRKPGYVLDFIIIPVSLGVEASVKGLGGFLIVARLWRLANVVRRIANAKQERILRKEMAVEKALKICQTNFMRLADRLAQKEKEQLLLENEIMRFKGAEPSALTSLSPGHSRAASTSAPLSPTSANQFAVPARGLPGAM